MKRFLAIIFALVLLCGCFPEQPYDLLPTENSTYNVGSMARYWDNGFFNNLTVNSLTIAGVPVTGDNVSGTGTPGKMAQWVAADEIANATNTNVEVAATVAASHAQNTDWTLLNAAGGANLIHNGVLVNDLKTDRWVTASNTNTLLGINVAGNDDLAAGGINNTAIGYDAIYDITTGFGNTAVGSNSLEDILDGYYNTAVGNSSLSDVSSGTNNTAVGELAGGYISTGSFNTAVGSQALLYNNGNYNTAVGQWAGDNNTGSSNVFLGYSAGQDSGAVSNKLYIANSNDTTPLIYGDFSTDTVTINNDLSMAGDIIMTPGATVDGVDVSTLAGGSSSRSATLKVAANNATALEKSQSDYVCDATSDEVQINAALTAAGAGSVELSSGTFKINAQISVTTGQTLRGQGDSTIITTNVNAINLIRGDGASGSELTGITIEKLVLNGTAGGFVAADLLYFDYVDYSTVQNCRFLNSGTADKAGALFSYCDNIKVISNTAKSNLGVGLSFANCAYADISLNICVSNSLSGIRGGTCTYTTVISNICHDNSGTWSTTGGIYFTSGSNILVSGNSCYTNVGGGVSILSATLCSITNNDCRNNSIGIFCSSTFTNISGNVCSYSTDASYGDGIFTVTATDCNIMGNLCSNNIQSGIRVGSSCNRNNVSGNACISNTQYGITVYNASYDIFGNNNLYGNKYGITLNLSSFCTVSGNGIAGSLTHGIQLVGLSTYNIVGNNIITGSSQTTTNTSDDIILDNSQYNSIQGNVCKAGGGAKVPKYGINISTSTCVKNIVEQNDLYDDGFGTAIWNDVGTLTIKRQNRGDTPVQQAIFIRVKNTSASNMTAGDVVTFKAVAAGNEVTLTTTQGDDLVFGMMSENVTINSWGMCQIEGYTTALKADGTTDIAIGDLLGTFTTAGIAMKAAAGDMVIAIALEAYTTDDSNGVLNVLIIKPRKL